MLTISIAVSAMEEGSGGISWIKNVDQAKSMALSENKIIMVDVFTHWCHWCKELDSKVFTDAAVFNLSSRMVNLKVNAEDGGAGQLLTIYTSKYSHREKYPISLYYMVVTKTVMGKKDDARKYLAELKTKFSDRKSMISRAEQVLSR